MGLIHGFDYTGSIKPIRIGSDGKLQVDLGGGGGALDVNVLSNDVPNDFKSYPHDVFTVLNATRILNSATANNAYVNILTVPTGFTFFMTFAYVVCNNGTASTRAGGLAFKGAISGYFGYFVVQTKANDVNSVAIPLSAPIKIAEGEAVESYSSIASLIVSCTVTGYLLPN